MASGTPLTEQDFELLSAYLDDALSPSARADLDSRLAAEPALRSALEALQETVALLKAAPRLTLPRNFTLDPAKYRRSAPWWARYRNIQFAGALGALASIVIIAVGLLTFATSYVSMPSSSAPLPVAKNGVVAVLPTATLNATTLSATSLDKAQADQGAAGAMATSVMLAATTTPAQTHASNEAALPNDAASGFAALPTATNISAARQTAPDLQSGAAGAVQAQEGPSQPPQAPSNSLAGGISGSGGSAKSIAKATQTPSKTDTLSPTATDTPTATPTTLPTATSTTPPAPPTAAAVQALKDQTGPSPSPLPQLLLAVGIALLVLSVMLIGIGWMRSRLKDL